MPHPSHPQRRSLHRALGAGLALSVLLATAACGGDEPEARPSASATPTALPTGDLEVPTGTDLTAPGTELGFGETATVPYQLGRGRGSVIGIEVQQVETGRIRDLSAFQLDEATRASTPYYVQVKVTNLGTGDVAGAPVPLFAVDDRDVLIQPSSFTTDFRRCRSGPLPQEFPQSSELTTCLVYLVREPSTLEAMSFRPLQDFAGITWTGEVEPARRGRS